MELHVFKSEPRVSTRVAIQGQRGSFHHTVAEKYFGSDIDLVYAETFSRAFAVLSEQGADYLVTAIENSLYGSLSDVYDLLLHYPFHIIGEYTEHIQQQLIGFGGTHLDDITEVYSHPAALSQCRRYLETTLPHAEVIEHHDTAGAVRDIKDQDMHHAAAIAGAGAAELYDMTILDRDIEDEKDNFTRFIVLSVSPAPETDLVRANKASLVLTTSHEAGALYRALGVFDRLHLNLTKLESRHIRGQAFRYQFFIDLETTHSQLQTAIHELESLGCDVRVLGEYRASTMPQA